MELGNALETILSGLANIVAQEALKYTVLSGKSSCLPPAACPLLPIHVVPNLCVPEAPGEPGTVLAHRNIERLRHLSSCLGEV